VPENGKTGNMADQIMITNVSREQCPLYNWQQ